MTVETITQPMSDFAIKLSNALKSIGHHYFGKVDYDKINVEEYLKLSPREMALRYAKEHDLDIKKKCLDILKHIYTENKKDNFKISMRELTEDKKMDYLLYSSALLRFGLVSRKGDRIRTEYRWLGSNAPVFSDAEAFYDMAMAMKNYALDQKSVDYIQNHITDDPDEIMQKLNPEDSNLKFYQVKRTILYKRTHHNAKERKLQSLLEARKTMDRELSRKMPEPAVSAPVTEQVNEVKEPEQEQAIIDIPKPVTVKAKEKKKEEDNMDQGLLYLMAQRVKMYKKITKIQEKMLRRYENKLKS